MTEERKKALTVGRNIGAVLGGIVFLTFGVVPAFYFGSFGAVSLLAHLLGGPLEPGIITRMIAVVGILLGMVCTASVSIVVGAVLGTGLGFVTDVVASAWSVSPDKAKALASSK